jgi:MFS family permease
VQARGVLGPLYAAGFVTAFGAHAVAANLGGYAAQHDTSLLELGGLLALYDGAEVVLKPVFGAVADRVGPRRVLLGGLLGFAVASLAFVAAHNPGLLAVTRLAQGMSAAAFSPAAGALVAIHGGRRQGRSFGGYGAAKSLGYLLGPLLGGALVVAGGYPLLFAVLGATALIVAAVVATTVPLSPPMPRHRETVADLVRRLGDSTFLGPVGALAGATGALSAGVGFLPVLGLRSHLGPLATGACVSLLAGTATVIQLRAGRALDDGRLKIRTGLVSGLVAAASGLAVAAAVPGTPGLVIGAVAIGAGVGITTPLGFAALAATAPVGRLGMTMGAAEVGRELGDAGGPLLVGALAVVSLGTGFVGLSLALAAIAALVSMGRTPVARDAHSGVRRPP